MTQKIGKYEIVRELGRGGMGVVYRAVDPLIGREVALKVLPPSLTESAELRERFLREARAAGRLQHPNIVVIHDLGEDQGNLYIAMEFLEGETLAARIAGGRQRMAVREALDVMAQVARGLQYAHQRGVVHRDIKPANILVSSEGVAKILDFGIARAGDKRMTKTGQVMGTIYYMSPEQINGQELDGRSDVFSAGVVLYELLTGVVPFDAESTGATMMKILTAPTPRLSERLPLSPAVLDEIVARALAKKPEERFASAAEFAAALESAKTASARTPAPAPTVPAARPDSLRETVVHPAAPAPIELQEFNGWEEKAVPPAAAHAPAAAAAAPARMPAPPFLEATAARVYTDWSWWHLFWPAGDSVMAAKVGCRTSAVAAFVLAALATLVYANTFYNYSLGVPDTDRGNMISGWIVLSLLFYGWLMLKGSRVAAWAPVVVAVSLLTYGLVTDYRIAGSTEYWWSDIGVALTLWGPSLPGLRGATLYHRLRKRYGLPDNALTGRRALIVASSYAGLMVVVFLISLTLT